MTPFAVVEDVNVLEEAAVRGLAVEPANNAKTLFRYKLHQDLELFDKAYGYVRQYY